MSLQQSKILLNKINTLHSSIETDGQISSIERDLMLSYIRQLYESFIGNSAMPSPAAPKPAEKVVERVVEKPTPPVAAVVVPPLAPQVVLEVERKPEPVIAKVPEPVVVTSPPVVVVETPKPTPPPPPVPVQQQVPPTLPTTVFPEPPKPKSAQKPLIKPANERIDQSELFEEKMRKELSDKLGEMPIDDIKKGMGLNERIIFLNDLFDGNAQEFENAVNTLNTVGSFEAAKNHLSLLASKFDWASKEKQAKPFIRLVRRRYNQ